jgi:uncharacterized protein (TIGR02246 family)
MLTNSALRVLVASAAGVAWACAPKPSPEPDPRPDIDAAQAAFWAAHEEGDAEALAALVTDQAVLWGPGMDEVSGREGLRAAAEGMFSAMSISDFEIQSRELTVHGDIAYELATYSETVTYQGAEPSAVTGRYLIVWRKEADGAWRVHRNMFHFVSGA